VTSGALKFLKRPNRLHPQPERRRFAGPREWRKFFLRLNGTAAFFQLFAI